MTRTPSVAACTLALALALAVAPATAVARPARTIGPVEAEGDTSTTASAATARISASNTLPGAAAQWIDAYFPGGGPITGELDASGTGSNFWTVYLEAGESAAFDLFGPDTGADLDLYLYDPAGLPALIDGGNNPGTSDEYIAGDVNVEGIWSVEVRATSGAGSYELYGTFASADDNVPGLPITATPVSARLDSFSEWDDIRRIPLNAGDVLTLTLTRTGTFTTGFNPAIYLYAPGTTDIWNASPFAGAEGTVDDFPKTISFTAPSAGSYYVDICAYTGEPTDVHEYGDALLSWRISSPVYRFFNFTNGTHFYTPSLGERDHVMATWPYIYQYEGVAYTTNPANSTQALYRFYNVRSGSHFYTASIAERDRVLNTLGYIYTYDGPTYAVNPGPVASSAPVYRFYNVRNGSHFYTASESERDQVSGTLGYIYQYEGPAFWIGQ